MNKMNAHKNDNPAVSVIIPVFNVEDYLDKCLESVANQSFSDMEIILVDDKSTDSSGLICDKWAAKDSRMRVIRNECNSGAAQCRNTGLDAASGEYVVFVDSDDYIDEKLAEKAYNALKENKAQIAVYGFQYVSDDFIGHVKFENDKNLYCGREVRDVLFPKYLYNYRKIIGAAWCEMISTDLLRKNKIRFPNDIITGEDAYFNILLYGKAERVAVIDEGLYFYNCCENKNSVTTTFNNKSLENARLYREKCAKICGSLGYGQDFVCSIDEHYVFIILCCLVTVMRSYEACADTAAAQYFAALAGDETFSCLFSQERYRSLADYFFKNIFSKDSFSPDILNFLLSLLKEENYLKKLIS